MIRKNVLITGASAGIGWAMALEYAKKGYNLVLTGRRLNRLAALKKIIELHYTGKVQIFSADVRKEKEMEKIILKVKQSFKTIDIVIANAGYTIKGAFKDLTIQDFRSLFETNFYGVLNTLYPVYPLLIKSRGKVLIIGSILGEFGIMNRSVYAASKFALKGLFESIRYEFLEQGIKTILVQVGFVNTEIRSMNKNGERLPVKERPVHRSWFFHEPEEIARKIVRRTSRMSTGVLCLPAHSFLLSLASRLFPGIFQKFIYLFRKFIRKNIFN